MEELPKAEVHQGLERIYFLNKIDRFFVGGKDEEELL